jgi:hypothetical protein
MKKILITYGAITSFLITFLMLMSTILAPKIGFDSAEIIGYTSLVLSFLVIYFALISYYKNNPAIKVTFLKSLAIGLLITLIASVAYTLVWLVLYYTVFPDFWDKYAAHIGEKLHKSGTSAVEIDKQVAAFKEFKEAYKNPLINAAYTFTEPTPVGILIALISSVVMQIRKKKFVRAA